MNKEKIAKTIFITLVIAFFSLLFAEASGYYQTKTRKVNVLTEEQIKMFEEDIKNNKDIDIEQYLTVTNKDYSTDLSKDLYSFSLKLEKVVDKSIKFIFKNAYNAVK